MRKIGIASVAAAALGYAPFAAAQDSWEFEVTPYLWATGMDGDAGVRGRTAQVDVSFSDILDNLDGAFLGLFTAEKGPWMLGFDGIYMDLANDGSAVVTGPGGRVSIEKAYDVSMTSMIFQGGAGYLIVDSTTRVHLVGAVRYTDLELDLAVSVSGVPELGFPGGALSASGSESWSDAVIGARIVYPLGSRWSLVGYADVGAGGSDLTYHFAAGANWAINDRFTLKGGYRYLYWDYEDNGTVWDVGVSGLAFGLGISF